MIAGSDNLFSLALFSTAGRASVIECLALESITGVGIETFVMLDVTVHGISSTVHGSMTNAHWHQSHSKLKHFASAESHFGQVRFADACSLHQQERSKFAK